MADRRVTRCDAAELQPAERMPNGFLRVSARIARVGIQIYENADGSPRRELRLPEEVFSPKSMASFAQQPVTNLHPPALLDSRSTRGTAVGSIGAVAQDGDEWLVAPLTIWDASTVADIDAGRQEVSVGYECELDERLDPELLAKWGPYDALQRSIVVNHLAVVDRARAGSEARLRLDAAGNAVVALNPRAHQETTHMPTQIRIDGLTYEIDGPNAPAVLQAIERSEKARADSALQSAATAKRLDDEHAKKYGILKKNALAVVAIAASLKGRVDAMKAKMMPCDECDGSGSVAAKAGETNSAKCDYCDGTGSIRMHDAIKTVEEEKGEGPAELEQEDEGEMLDADQLEVEQASETEASKAHKDAAAKLRRKQHADAAKLARQRRRDSFARMFKRSATARAALLVEAMKHVDAETKLDELDDAGIRRAVVAKLKPTVKLDGKSERDVALLFEVATADASASAGSAVDRVRGGVIPTPIPRGDGRNGVEKSAADWSTSRADAWKTPAAK